MPRDFYSTSSQQFSSNFRLSEEHRSELASSHSASSAAPSSHSRDDTDFRDATGHASASSEANSSHSRTFSNDDTDFRGTIEHASASGSSRPPPQRRKPRRVRLSEEHRLASSSHSRTFSHDDATEHASAPWRPLPPRGNLRRASSSSDIEHAVERQIGELARSHMRGHGHEHGRGLTPERRHTSAPRGAVFRRAGNLRSPRKSAPPGTSWRQHVEDRRRATAPPDHSGGRNAHREAAVARRQAELARKRDMSFLSILYQLCSILDPTPKMFLQWAAYFYSEEIVSDLSLLKNGAFLTSPTFFTPSISPQSSPSARGAGNGLQQSAANQQLVRRSPITDANPVAVAAVAPVIHPMLSGPVNSLNPRDIQRYKRDFVELELLGKGGFGSVFKARHKVDQRLYAVKQIKFTNRGFQSPHHAKVMREVKNMAKLDHPNVCRYHQSWFEWVPEQPTRDADGNVRMPGARVSVMNSSGEATDTIDIGDAEESRFEDVESSFRVDSELESRPGGYRRRRISIESESIHVHSSVRQTSSPGGGSTIEFEQTTDVSTSSFDMATLDIGSSRKSRSDSLDMGMGNGFGFGIDASIGAPHFRTLAEERSAVSRASNASWTDGGYSDSESPSESSDNAKSDSCGVADSGTNRVSKSVTSGSDAPRKRSGSDSSDSANSDSCGVADSGTRISEVGTSKSGHSDVLEEIESEDDALYDAPSSAHSATSSDGIPVAKNANLEHNAVEEARAESTLNSSRVDVVAPRERHGSEESDSSSSAAESAQRVASEQTHEKSAASTPVSSPKRTPVSSPKSSGSSTIQLVDIDAPHNVIRPLFPAGGARSPVKTRAQSARASPSPRRAPKASAGAIGKHACASSDESSLALNLEECPRNQSWLHDDMPDRSSGMRRSFSDDRLVQRRAESHADSKDLLPYRSDENAVQELATRVKAQEAARVVNEVATLASKAKYTMVLYIQTQLCGPDTLKSMLDRRNSSKPCVIDVDENMGLFCQLLLGLEHIHFCGIIHRDLKPENVLSTKERGRTVLKIGDFGLSKIPDEECTDEPSSQLPTSTISHSTLPTVELPPHVSYKHLRMRRHTQGVGTRVYSSPEQMTGVNYCKKTDIYSLGIILMELFYPFTTAMERQKCLDSIRSGRVPTEFAERYPAQARLIQWMTSKKPGDRPSASELLRDRDVEPHTTTMRVDYSTPPASPQTSPQISVMSSPPTSASAGPSIASFTANGSGRCTKAAAEFDESSSMLPDLSFEMKDGETSDEAATLTKGDTLTKAPIVTEGTTSTEELTWTEAPTATEASTSTAAAIAGSGEATKSSCKEVKGLTSTSDVAREGAAAGNIASAPKSKMRSLNALMSSVSLAGARDDASATPPIDLSDAPREDLLAVIMRQSAEVDRLNALNKELLAEVVELRTEVKRLQKSD